MKKLYLFKNHIFLVMALLFLSACNKELDKYYEVPEWLKGSAWEVLEKKGNYTIFLRGIEKSGYKDLVEGNGIVTVMAPDDAAFKAYFAKKGIDGIESLDHAELARLINYHLVYYNYNREALANYNPNGSMTSNEANEGLYYKFRTKSQDAISLASDHTSDIEIVRKIYHKDRFLPVFSGYMFRTKNIDAETNYKYFYPNSAWSNGALNDFNVSNASVLEYAIITDNGFIYNVSQVLEPLETIYTELGDSDYSVFRNCFDRFAVFWKDVSASTSFGNGDSLFVRFHNDIRSGAVKSNLPQIASEWAYNGETSGTPDYAELAKLSKDACNIFAPNNTAMTDFFNTFWRDGVVYNSIDDVNFIPLLYLLDNHSWSGALVFPEEITKGQIKTRYRTTISFDVNQVTKRNICVNGALYGLSQVIVPPIFTTVMGPAFKYPRFNMFLTMIHEADYISTLATDQIDYKLFYPSDSTLKKYSTIDGRELMYQNLSSKKYGSQSILMSDFDQPWIPITRYYESIIVASHTATKLMTRIGTQQVYKTLVDFQYLLVDGDEIYSSVLFNAKTQNPSRFREIDVAASNGKCYEIIEGYPGLMPDYATFKAVIINPMAVPNEYTGFKGLIESSGVHLTSPAYNFLMGDRFIVFVPTNQALIDYAAKIPSDQAALAELVKYHFASVPASKLFDYPFPGAGIEGTLKSFQLKDGRTQSAIELTDTGTGLQVRDAKGNTANIVGVFPRMYSDGAVYLIDGILEY